MSDDNLKDDAIHAALMLHLRLLAPKNRAQHINGLMDLATTALGAIAALTTPDLAMQAHASIGKYLDSEGASLHECGADARALLNMLGGGNGGDDARP